MIKLSLLGLRTRSSFPNRSFIIMIIPMFLIISSGVYPAIISAIQNKEMLIIAEAVAQLEGDNSNSKQKKSNADTSGYHATMAKDDLIEQENLVYHALETELRNWDNM